MSSRTDRDLLVDMIEAIRRVDYQDCLELQLNCKADLFSKRAIQPKV